MWLWLITCIVTSSLLPTPSDARFYCISNLLYTLDGETTCNQDANGLVVAANQPGFYCDRIANLDIVRESPAFSFAKGYTNTMHQTQTDTSSLSAE